jgi:type-F conjugative transfer system secretin TraK
MKKLSFINFLIILFLSNHSFAAQIKDLEDGDEFNAEISRTDLNRIKVVGDRIRDVKINNMELDISLDEKVGEVYIRAAHSAENKPINIFIITQQNFTYKGILYPKSIPAEQIILRNNMVPAGGEMEVTKVGKNSYEQQVISLIKAMREKKRLESYQIKYEKKYVDLGDLSMRRNTVYKGQNFIGEIFVLKNSTNQVLNLEEKIFFKNGVKAVKIEKADLLPDESTEVLIIN